MAGIETPDIETSSAHQLEPGCGLITEHRLEGGMLDCEEALDSPLALTPGDTKNYSQRPVLQK